MESILVSLLPLIIQQAPTFIQAIETGVSVNSIGSLIENPSVLSAFESLGAQLFPKAAPAIQVAGALIKSYSPNYVKWIQGMLNAYLNPAVPLVVDGLYGPKTTAAVDSAQAKLGLKVDGVAGDLTSSALAAIIAAVPPKTA